VLSWEARYVPAERDKECGRYSSSLDVAVYEIAEALLGSNVTEDDAIEELALESF
jgi:hypothetical protein